MILKTHLRDGSISDELAKSLRLDKNKKSLLIRVCRNNDISFLGKIKVEVKTLYHERN